MESDENTSRLETPSDAFTRLCGLILSELRVLDSLPSSFQDGVRSGSRTCGHPRKRGSFSAGAAEQARWKGGQGSHPEGSQGASTPRWHCEPCTQPGVRQPNPLGMVREII